MKIKNKTLNLAIATSALLFSASSHAFLIDFDTGSNSPIVHGTVIGSHYSGITISGVNNDNGLDFAVAYDSTPGTDPANQKFNSRDPDLEGPGWGNTNLGDVSGLQLGNLLIIQENSTGCNTGVCTYPDDEGSRPSGGAGSLYFDFDTAITSFGFDLIDVEGPTEYADGGYAAVFKDDIGNELGSIGFGALIGRDGADYGNNSVNRISEIDFVSELGLSETDMVTRVEINFGGSAGIDNIMYSTTPNPPQSVAEPTSLILLAIGLTGLGLRRRNCDPAC